tara:strand:- start:40 stop:249 length:210 start_codon:yes stop_codon:yes gene_type:complete
MSERFEASFLGAQVGREVGRFLSKQLPGLRTLFTWDQTNESGNHVEKEMPCAATNKLDIYLHIRFISII